MCISFNPYKRVRAKAAKRISTNKKMKGARKGLGNEEQEEEKRGNVCVIYNRKGCVLVNRGGRSGRKRNETKRRDATWPAVLSQRKNREYQIGAFVTLRPIGFGHFVG